VVLPHHRKPRCLVQSWDPLHPSLLDVSLLIAWSDDFVLVVVLGIRTTRCDPVCAVLAVEQSRDLFEGESGTVGAFGLDDCEVEVDESEVSVSSALRTRIERFSLTRRRSSSSRRCSTSIQATSLQ
jgi:hypothetical protein